MVQQKLLINIADEKIYKEWQIDLNDPKIDNIKNNTQNIWISTSLLLDDGSVVITEGEGPMINISRCNKINWVLDKHTHHSINKIDDKNLIINTVKYDNDFNYM